MTTKLLDSTVSEILQPNVTVSKKIQNIFEDEELQADSVIKDSFITASDEQVPTVSETARDFDFHAEHNGEACIESLKPEDKGTERQYRFTRALLCTLLGVKSVNTIDNHIEALIKRGVVSVVKNLTTVKIANSVGAVNDTTLYDLTVFNHLVMRLDTDQAWAMKEKFNDVLIKHETQAQPELSDAEIMSRALEIAHRTLALREERIKALQAERDEALRRFVWDLSKQASSVIRASSPSVLANERNHVRKPFGSSQSNGFFLSLRRVLC